MRRLVWMVERLWCRVFGHAPVNNLGGYGQTCCICKMGFVENIPIKTVSKE